jgi:hypothetical protein
MWKQISSEEVKNRIICRLTEEKRSEVEHTIYIVDMEGLCIIDLDEIVLDTIKDYLDDDKNTVFILWQDSE